MIQLNYNWDDLVDTIDWTLVDETEQSETETKINAFHPLQPRKEVWQSISDHWPSDYTVAQLKRQTVWDSLEPMHYDSSMSCLKRHFGIKVDPTQAERFWIALQDWQIGHSLTIEDKVITDWKAGDWFSWNNKTAHRADNVGPHTRYVLILTKYWR